MHSTSTVTVLDGVTKILGQLLRRFNDHVCPKYNTRETPSEMKERTHRIVSEAAKKNPEQFEDCRKGSTYEEEFQPRSIQTPCTGPLFLMDTAVWNE